MKNTNTSSFQSHFIFNACMNHPGIEPQPSHIHSKPLLKNIKKIYSTKTLGKPVSMQDLHLTKKPKILKNYELNSPSEQILKPKHQPKLLNPSLANSLRTSQNQVYQHDKLIQSQSHRKSRYEGNKIKIFSNDNSKGSIKVYDDRGQSVSRESHGHSGSKQKKGIQVTKSLLKKISGMYGADDFNKSSQATSNRTSLHQKSDQKNEKDSFYNQTGFLMTTWDSQRTTEEYQLSKQYDSTNNYTRDNFGLGSYGTMNMLNNSYESNRICKDLPRNSFNYLANETTEYSMRHDGQLNNTLIENQGKRPICFSNSTSANKIIDNPILIKQQGVPLPSEYQQNQQRPSYHMGNSNELNQKKLSSSFSKGKMGGKMSKSKVFSSNNNNQGNQSSAQNQQSSHQNLQKSNQTPQKNSLVFSKSKQFPKMTTNIQNKHKHVLFQTAHQILSQQVSSIKQPFQFSQTTRQISGQELTNMLYGNKDASNIPKKGHQCQQMDQNQKQKYLVRYKNKTLDDLSIKQSMVEGYDNYYH